MQVLSQRTWRPTTQVAPRPKVSANAWAMGRVKIFCHWRGGARKADADLLKGGKSGDAKKDTRTLKAGLNAAGRAHFKRTEGLTCVPSQTGDNPRRASFLARMAGNSGPERDAKGKPTRLLLSLQAWGASSKADARRKAALSVRD